jgi:hypothetical protein
MKGTILDFLKLAGEKPELAQELAKLAGKYDFEFAPWDELSHSDLDSVAGGVGKLDSMLGESGGDVLGGVFGVMKEAISDINTDSEAMKKELAERNAVSSALGEHLKTINDGLL